MSAQQFDPNDAIQSLARIAACAAKDMALLHRHPDARLQDDIDHMRANLNHIEEEVKRRDHS